MVAAAAAVRDMERVRTVSCGASVAPPGQGLVNRPLRAGKARPMSVAHSDLLIAASDSARPVRVIAQGQALSGKSAAWAEANGFTGKAGQLLIVPGDDGAAAEVLFGAGEAFEPMTARSLPTRLPAGDWRLDGVEGEAASQAALAFALGGYLFDRVPAGPCNGRTDSRRGRRPKPPAGPLHPRSRRGASRRRADAAAGTARSSARRPRRRRTGPRPPRRRRRGRSTVGPPCR